MEQMQFVVTPTHPTDAGEMLVLQRAAYVTEAQIYGDPHLPALVQTVADLERELRTGVGLKAVLGHRMVGAIRGRPERGTLFIGRLVVAPDLQGRGIGSRLLGELEAQFVGQVTRFELFTGSLSLANMRLYERFGYEEFRRERMSRHVELVFMEKPAPATASG